MLATEEWHMLAVSHMDSARGVTYLFVRRHTRNQARDFDDLAGAAYLGLVIAARNFDPKRGVPFWGYARHYVKRELYRCLNNETGRGRRKGTLPVSRDADVMEPREDKRSRSPSAGIEEREELKHLMAGLTPTEKRIVALRYGDGYTIQEVAEAIKFTKEGVLAALGRSRRKLVAVWDNSLPTKPGTGVGPGPIFGTTDEGRWEFLIG